MKLVHTSLTVKNMDETLRFYIDILGLKLLRRREIPENNAEIAFVAEGKNMHKIEFTWWRDKKDYVEGDQLDHLAFEVADVEATVRNLRQKAVEIAREPYSLKGSKSKLAFIKDPNGIWIELIQP